MRFNYHRPGHEEMENELLEESLEAHVERAKENRVEDDTELEPIENIFKEHPFGNVSKKDPSGIKESYAPLTDEEWEEIHERFPTPCTPYNDLKLKR